jgi:hypothetical protein
MPQRAAVALDRLAGDRQAHPRSGVLLAVQSLEHGEQALFGTGLDADAVVDDGDLQPLGEEVAGDLDPRAGPDR